MAVSKLHMSELKERLMNHGETVPKQLVSSADLVAPSGAGGGRDPADSPQGEQSSEDMGDQSESGQSPQVRSAEASRGSGLDADGQQDHRGVLRLKILEKAAMITQGHPRDPVG